eukprot:6195494-Pleurochrysis_carterae.AAC.1
MKHARTAALHSAAPTTPRSMRKSVSVSDGIMLTTHLIMLTTQYVVQQSICSFRRVIYIPACDLLYKLTELQIFLPNLTDFSKSRTTNIWRFLGRTN